MPFLLSVDVEAPVGICPFGVVRRNLTPVELNSLQAFSRDSGNIPSLSVVMGMILQPNGCNCKQLNAQLN